jgi:hypothetical protein
MGAVDFHRARFLYGESRDLVKSDLVCFRVRHFHLA